MHMARVQSSGDLIVTPIICTMHAEDYKALAWEVRTPADCDVHGVHSSCGPYLTSLPQPALASYRQLHTYTVHHFVALTRPSLLTS